MKKRLIYLLLICVLPVIGNAQENYRLELVKTEPVTTNKKRGFANKLKEIRTIGGKVVGYETPMYVGLVDTGKIILNNGVEILTDIQGVTYVSDDKKTIVRWGNKTSTIKNKMKRNSFNEPDSMFIVFYNRDGERIKSIDTHKAFISKQIQMSENGSIVVATGLQADTNQTITLYNNIGEMVWRKNKPNKISYDVEISNDAKYVGLLCSNSGSPEQEKGNLYLYSKGIAPILLRSDLSIYADLFFSENMLIYSSSKTDYVFDVSTLNLIYSNISNSLSPRVYFGYENIILLKETIGSHRHSSDKIEYKLLLWDCEKNNVIFNIKIPEKNRFIYFDRVHDDRIITIHGDENIYYYQLKK